MQRISSRNGSKVLRNKEGLMKTIHLLKDAIEEADVSEFSNWPPLDVLEETGRVGCTCDRWGHPCPNCDDKPKAQTAESSSVEKPDEKS